jgi:threonine/homoserine/homoserine lactone efflux protein
VRDALLVGIGYGLAAGVAPGPLLALTVAATLRGGRAAGSAVAIAPILTDAPIVAAAILAADRVPETALAVIGLAGAAFVIWLGVGQVRARAEPASPSTLDGERSAALRRGIVANLLSPHPYLFWATVGTPVMSRLDSESGVGAVSAFLVAFYVLLVGTKIAIAQAVHVSRHWLSGRGYRLALAVTGIALVVLGVLLGIDSVRQLTG